MNFFILLIVAIISKTNIAALSSDLGPVVNVGYAAFAGNTTSPAGVSNGPVAFFGGIPFAQPPLGNLRFRAPQPLNENESARSVMDARNWGPACIQRPAVVGIGSEDCLTLNIWKPTNATTKSKLPVVVYIHGGGFYYGTPQGFPMYDWVAQHQVIGISITYRLGILGFLGGSEVSKDGDLNAGLLDQRAALEWIQRHITSFGGDPENVTISGESAGGASVMMQIVAYGGDKPVPFKRAIAQSIGFGPTASANQTEANFNNAATYAGCLPSDGPVMECLRKASIGAIVSATNRTPNGAFAPIIDGLKGFLPDLPSRLITAGRFNPVEFTGGHCTGDGNTFAGGKPTQFVTEDDIRTHVFSRWPGVMNDTITQALSLYPAPDAPDSPFATQYERATAIAGDVVFTCMDLYFAEKNLQKGVQNVFAFAWNAPDTVLYNANPYLGAMHTSDIYYLFSGTNVFGNAGNYFTPFNASEAALSTEAIAYWTSFATTGDPSAARKSVSPVWSEFKNANNSTARSHLVLTRGGDVSTASVMQDITDAQIERCQFWMSDAVVAQTGV
ncbi:alpha/beta-hydrolase [Pholiota conissans]|uniref:Carboxylic ester hydrolase n=1 Tax=Pholiota conissans TaxID=109636 RepID=A0A9P5Z4F1_9AGAR|nr:alpha/beta-hydrolase [Pholiota conissans]